MRWIVVGLFVLLASAAFAQSPPPGTDRKIDELVRLLDDPDVRAWLDNRKSETQPVSNAVERKFGFATGEASIRERVNRILGALPRIPEEVGIAATRTREEAIASGYAPMFAIFAGLSPLVSWQKWYGAG